MVQPLAAVKLALLGVLLVNLASNVRANSDKLDRLPPLISEDETTTEASTVLSSTKQAEISTTYNAIASSESPASSPEAEQTKKDTTRDNSLTTATFSDSTQVSNQDKPSQQEQEIAQPTTSGRDINILLANKDDAENDLGSPSDSRRMEAKPPVVVVSEEVSPEKIPDNLDSPVEINKANDDRFHYSLSKPQPDEVKPTTVTNPESSSSAAPKESPVEKDESTDSKITDQEDIQKPKVEKTNQEAQEKSTTAEVEDKSKENKQTDTGFRATPEEAVKVEKESPVSISTTSEEPKTTSTSTSTSTTTTTTTSAPIETTTEKPKTIPDETSTVFTTSTSTSSPSTEITKMEKPAVESTTIAAKSQPSSTLKPFEKPSNVPSILAVALGTALGAAANPLGKKEQVQPTPSSSPSSTSRAPASTSSSKKPILPSSSDKWDRWSPTTGSSSTTNSPSTRRRPILPSIRRRFRPYNRFSPFPWGGAEAYSPAGSNPDFNDDPLSTSPRPPRATTSTPGGAVTLKPRRRSTTESPKESKPSSSVSPSSTERSSYDDDSSSTPTTSTRRQHPHGNRRRPSHHHGHHGFPDFHEEVENDHRRPSPHHRHHHHRHHHRHHHDGPSDEQSSMFGEGAYQQPGGLGGLFNNPGSSMGSGFDLLNPFSSWFDDFSRPKPSRNPTHFGPSSRQPGHRPIAVNGEYPDIPVGEIGSGPSGHHYGHEHTHGQGHSGRPHNGRDDYNHNCHHDHDNDYDHHNHRPHRPNKEREPYRPTGDYDTYPPNSSSYGGGRRPYGGRPYNTRTDQGPNGSENRDQLESSSGNQPGEPLPPSPLSPTSVRTERQDDPMTSRSRPLRPSIFTPFDTLFGSLDDDLFTFRSSLFESPFIRSSADSSQPFDAIVSSPKLSMASPMTHKETSESKPKITSSPS